MEDMYKMSSMMKNLFPSTPEQDLAALKAMANAPVQQAEQKVDYLKESAKVNEGSLPMDKNYSVSDFAKLAGVQSTPTKEDTFSTAIAHIDKELDAGDPMLAATALQRAVNGDTLTTTERKELAPYLDLFKHLITDPGMRLRILSMAELLNKKTDVDKDDTKNERELTKGEIKSRDKTADKIMDKPKAKKSIASWAKDKGMDPEGAVYAIATNMAKKNRQNSSVDNSNLNSIKERLYKELSKVK
tara:strand:+ start:1022 stop:1753 length:732 start_codon:yes stop_codon:yes gene_type:complete